MSKKEEFKSFIKDHPEIVGHIKNKNTNLQELYELYDIYGSDSNVWDKYFIDNTSNGSSINELTNLVKNINMDNIQKHINTAQKAIGVIQELTKKNINPVENIISKTPRPLTKFFND